MKKPQKKNVRKIVQVFFLILIALISINHTLAESGREIPFLSQASIHGICPFGGVVILYNLATAGDFIQKIHSSAVILMALVFLLAVLFGPVFCGWVCPQGGNWELDSLMLQPNYSPQRIFACLMERETVR